MSAALHVLIAFGLSPRGTHQLAWTSPTSFEVSLAAISPDSDGMRARVSTDDAVRVAARAPRSEDVVPGDQSDAPSIVARPVEFNLPFDRYYAARELDVRAAQTNEVQLIYPKQAFEMRISGKVTLRIFINEQGGIDMTSILAATPPGVFDEAAFTAAQALQFSPALKNGHQVKSQKTIEVVFDPYERIGMP